MADNSGGLGNPHRHCRALMPFVPQKVLSRLAARAGLGEVLDVRVDRESTAAAAGELDAYLAKQGRLYVPGHPMLSSYFSKQAAEPDTFNALPPRAARVRVNYPVPRPPKRDRAENSFFAAGIGVYEARRRWLPWTLDRDDPDWFPAARAEDLAPRSPPSENSPEQLGLPLPRQPTHNPLPL